jgi:hypothetical protein
MPNSNREQPKKPDTQTEEEKVTGSEDTTTPSTNSSRDDKNFNFNQKPQLQRNLICSVYEHVQYIPAHP